MIKSIDTKNFLGFKTFKADELTSVNVIIGPNDSGKTALLKLLYGVSKSLEDFQTNQSVIQQAFKKVLSEKLLNTFQPRKNGLGELVNRSNSEKLSAEIMFDGNQVIHFSFGESTTTNIIDCTEDSEINKQPDQHNSIFVPAKEVLTAFDAIALTRERFNMIGFDDTYYDLILDLRVPVQQGRIISEFNKVNNELEEL
ncbi:MAG: AAA family ATPase, partial [Sphingobacterium siyangense]